jgi:acetyl-CoA acetyltransferase
MKALQDAYIVAATRAPVGKSGRGALRTTRPDDLFAQTLKHLLTPRLCRLIFLKMKILALPTVWG